MKGVRVVAFDCDGVMFDSTAANTTYYNRILDRFHRPPLSPEQFEYAHMHTGDEVIAYLFDDHSGFQAAQQFRRQMGYFKFIPLMKPEPNLVSLLDWLRPKYHTAIATNRTDTIDAVLDEFNLSGYFDLVVHAGVVTRPKPDPEILMRILHRFQLSPNQAVYIGDSLLDAEASRAAGIPFIAFNNRLLPAAHHVQCLDEVRSILVS